MPTASAIWGLSQKEYIEKADPWPLNPNGEILLGLKIEDKRALAHVNESLSVPGIAFAEWGPGDMALSLGIPGARPTILRCLTRGRQCWRRARAIVFFLNTVRPNDVTEMIKEGVMIGSGGAKRLNWVANSRSGLSPIDRTYRSAWSNSGF